MKNFAQTKPNAEFGSYRRQDSTLTDSKFSIFPSGNLALAIQKGAWLMKTFNNERITSFA